MPDGELKKLVIEAYKDPQYNNLDGIFTAMFNPEKYSLRHAIEYDNQQGAGTSGSPQKFAKVKPQDLSLEFVIDGTGVASRDPSGADYMVVDVQDKVDEFLKLCYEYKGDEHRSRHLLVVWGTLVFKCVLKSAEIAYSLFKPDGRPLRAKITAGFSGNVDDELRAARERDSSPDMTHIRIVQEGDTLPLMTHRIYGDMQHYLDVARVNNLTNFRTLQPGQQLIFPPISKTE